MSFAKYAQVFNIGLQNTFVYRWNFFLRSLFSFVPLIGTVFIWKAMFQGRHHMEIGGYDFGGMIYYFLLTLLVNNLVTPTEDEWQIATDIREGQINALMIKPVNYLHYRISLFLSYRLLYTVVTIVPIVVVFAWFRQYATLPHDALTWWLAALSLAMAGAIQFFIAYSLAMLAFWFLEISTFVFILYSFEYFLSGQLFPLDIMPTWFQSVLKFLPFTYEIYFPVAIWLHKVRGTELWSGLAVQAAWALLLWMLAKFLWNRGLRKHQAVGG